MRVLVTRPEPGASRTAARLSALGHEAVVLPLTMIAPLDPAMPRGAFDAVAVTSANAARLAPDTIRRSFGGVPGFAVGGATAGAMLAAGFAMPKVAEGDASSLARLIQETMPAGAQIAYLAGRVRKPDFETALHAQGFRVTAIDVYDTVTVSYPHEAARLAFDPRPDWVLLYSALAARHFGELALSAGVAKLSGGEMRLACLSARVADALPPAFAGLASVAQGLSEESLLQVIEEEGGPPFSRPQTC